MIQTLKMTTGEHSWRAGLTSIKSLLGDSSSGLPAEEEGVMVDIVCPMGSEQGLCARLMAR